MTSSGSTLLFGAVPAKLRPSPGEKRALVQFVHALCHQVCRSQPFVCLLADDEHLHRLNRTFLGQDYATDVLSFPSIVNEAGTFRTAKPEARRRTLGSRYIPPPSLGEIAISLERAAAQAAAFGHASVVEIEILMLHGVLHLTGLDHEDDDGKMAREEELWRAQFQLPETLIVRAGRQAHRSRNASQFKPRKALTR